MAPPLGWGFTGLHLAAQPGYICNSTLASATTAHGMPWLASVNATMLREAMLPVPSFYLGSRSCT
eukprot:146130-Chlamydomonas_euryale.AAC.1